MTCISGLFCLGFARPLGFVSLCLLPGLGRENFCHCFFEYFFNLSLSLFHLGLWWHEWVISGPLPSPLLCALPIGMPGFMKETRLYNFHWLIAPLFWLKDALLWLFSAASRYEKIKVCAEEKELAATLPILKLCPLLSFLLFSGMSQSIHCILRKYFSHGLWQTATL